MKRSAMKSLAAAFAAVTLASGTAAAQERRGFYFEMPLTVEFALERGMPVSGLETGSGPGVREIDDLVLIFRPAAPSFRLIRRRVELALKYEPDVEVFADNRELSAVNHAAAAIIDLRLTRRLTLRAGDAFHYTHDPSRALGPTTFLMGRGLLMQNTFYGGLDFRATPLTTLGFRFDQSTSSLDFGPVAIFPEQVDRYWSGTLTHRLTRTDEIQVAYTLVDASAPEAVELLGNPDERIRSAATGFRSFAHTVTLGYRRDITEAVSFETSGGFIRDPLSTNYAVSARLEARLKRGLSLIGGYDRGLSHAAYETFVGEPPATFRTDLAPASLLQSVTARLEGALSPRVRIDLQVWAARRTPGVTPVVEPRLLGGETFWGRFRLEWWAGERVAIFGGFDKFDQDDTILAGIPIDRRRFVTGLRLGLTPRMAAQDTETNR
jgi:hypothetical protein